MNAMMFNTGDLILDAVILSIVARTPEGTYGYKITQDVRSKMDVPESTFYPLLKQMQMDGYLEVYHKDLGGRSRRFYKITEAGKERLEFCQQNWANYLQSASTLLMGGAQQTSAAPAADVPSQPEAAPIMEEPVAVAQSPVEPLPQEPVAETPVAVEQPVMETAPVQEDTFEIAGNNTLDDFDFSIGGEEPMVAEEDGLSSEGDLFEFDSVPETGSISFDDGTDTAPVMEQPQVMYQEPVAEAPVAFEEPPMDVMPQEPVAEAPVAFEEPPMDVMSQEPVAESIPTEMDDEADFLAEMAMGEAETSEETASQTEMSMDGIENTFAESAEISELEDLISQLRSFESVMNKAHLHQENTVEQSAPAQTAPVSSAVNITDINGVAALLNTPSAQPASEPQPTAQKEVQPNPVAEAPTQAPAHNVRYTEVRNPETEDSINSLVDLLKDDGQPKKKARFFRSRAQKAEPKPVTAEPVVQGPVPVVNTVKEEPKKPEVAQEVHKIPLTEVRNPETNDAVNSLVDLLKDDTTSSKPKLFRGWGSKKSSGAAQFIATPDSIATPSPEPVAKAEPVAPAPKQVVSEPVATQATKMAYKEIHTPENNDAVGGLVDLLKGNESSAPSNPKIFTPKAQKKEPVPAPSMKAPEPVPTPVQPTSVPTAQTIQPAKAAAPTPAQPVMNQKVREVSNADNSVDSLVELLKDDKPQSKPVSIFGKTRVMTQKVSSTAQVSQPVTDTAIPKPVVSEPKVFKPTATKTFEEKAASPNARPVETTATITKSLDAKAISTKPTVAKPAEAKSVETKAVVTPKADTAPAATAEKKEEEVPMDSFKYRLMQAHLLPEEK